jgi:polyisoprenoid-binding protein YceI
MRRLAVAVAGAVLVSTGSVWAQAAPDVMPVAESVQRYDIDGNHSYVGFVVRHLAVANVRGRFTRFSGQVTLDENDVRNSSVNVTIDAGSIDTNNERRDNHLRSADFFDVETFPSITFVSSGVEPTAEGFVMTGTLTIRDVSRQVGIPFELVGPVTADSGRRRLGAEGTLRLNRFDFGLQWNRIQEAVQVVGDEVRIELNIEANTPRQD